MAAQATVLGINELLENILINLSHRDIYVSARAVCRRWHGIVEDSTPVKKKLSELWLAELLSDQKTQCEGTADVDVDKSFALYNRHTKLLVQSYILVYDTLEIRKKHAWEED